MSKLTLKQILAKNAGVAPPQNKLVPTKTATTGPVGTTDTTTSLSPWVLWIAAGSVFSLWYFLKRKKRRKH